MVQFLSPEEQKLRKKLAARVVRIIFILFAASLGAGIIFLSSNERKNKVLPTKKAKTFGFKFEFRQRKNDQKMDVYIDGRLFTSYCYNEKLKKPIFFPVITGSDKIVTRGYPLDPRPFEPTDHPYHLGIWFAHGVVNGLDFWSNADSIPSDRLYHYGTIRHQSFIQITSGNENGILEVACTWERADGRILMDEQSKFVFSAGTGTRIIDRRTKLTARETSVQFQDSKEGMYCIRVARELEQPSNEPQEYLDENLKPVTQPKTYTTNIRGLYENSDGLTGNAVWGKRAKWVKLSSVMDGEPVSIIMFDHPSNPNYPSHWMARGYGLFGINPFGSEVYSEGKESLNYFLPADSSVTFHYRMIIVNGITLSGNEVEKMHEEFISKKQNN